MAERVRLSFDDGGFSADMRRIAEASKALTMALELPAATWEPHDWREFD